MHTLPKLPYDYNALEPHIDEQTMRIHHTKHHQAYIDKLNMVLEKYPKLQDQNLSDLMMSVDELEMEPADKQTFINNGGGHLNHSFFWQIMGPKKEADDGLVAEIEKKFGSLEDFKKEFEQAALNRFGSGWAWLVRNVEGDLAVMSTPNQNSPFLDHLTPIIGLDVWEHAYYLKYQNKRPNYVKAWWNVLRLLP